MSTHNAPDLIKLYIKSGFIGFLASAVFVALLLWFDVAALWRLVSGSPVGVIAVIMMWVFNGIVFAGVQFAITIMSMSDDDDDHGGKHQRVLQSAPVLVPVRATKDRNPSGWRAPR